MEILNATEILAALGHESRLGIFRLLVEAGPEGVNASALGERLGIPGPTLSFHLTHLSHVGLVTKRQQGRFIFYAANYTLMDDLVAFLTANCCGGRACLPEASRSASTSRRRRKPSAGIRK
jgi:ArsR family transcriptional regulator, arsenate/arsenite/antimonite-responsive transcriptional repressor